MNLQKGALILAAFSFFLLPMAAKSEEETKLASSGTLIAQGEGLAKGGKWDEAQELFLQACSKDPTNKVALHDLAMSYAHTDRLSEAADCERKALALDENYVPSHVELAWILGKLDEKDEARAHLKKALEIEPDNRTARKNLEAMSMPNLRHFRREQQSTTSANGKAGAKIAATKVTETEVSKALCERGIAMYRQARYDVAKRFFEQALQNCPDSATARVSLGVVLGSMGDYEGQIREEKKVIQADPKNAAAYANLAWALAQKGELSDSLLKYQKALEFNPKLMDAQAGQGLLLCRMGKYEASLAILKETAKLYPESATVQLALGTVLEEVGRGSEALSSLQEAIKLAPNSTEVKTRLAAAYLDTENFDKAAELYKQLLEKNPNNSELRIGYGLVLTKTNDLNSAYLQFRKAAELDKNLAAAHACLSMVEEMRGRLVQAESEAKIAHEKDPQSKFFTDSVERLAKSRRNDDM
jgi:tetratricopeptide (TPR) repeat protein